MKTAKKELLKVLESVKPGIASRGVVESMAYFLFSGTDIITYNDKISIQHPFKTDFNLFVKADDLYKMMTKLSVDDVALAEKDGKLHVQCETMQADLATIEDDEISARIANVDKSLKTAKFLPLPDNFCESVSLCSFIASKQESYQTLTCVHVTGENCISSDNMRIAHATMDGKVTPMFIEASEVRSLIAINPTEYAISKAWLHFRNEDKCIFSIRKVNGDFPDFVQFFDFKGTEIKLPKSLIEGMDIASVFTDDLAPQTEINISKGVCIISVKSDSGTIKYRSKIDYSGSDIVFRINPDFLKEMMAHTSSIIVHKDKVRLETDNFALVTALCK